ADRLFPPLPSPRLHTLVCPNIVRASMRDPASDRPSPPTRNAPATSLDALSLTDSAAARVAEQINSGKFRPGQRLPAERTLAAELDVSRPALREALRALQSAGLVQSRRGSGWYV